MRITPIQNQLHTPNYTGNKKVSPKPTLNAKAVNNPAKEVLTTTGAWFAFGVGLDFISRKLTFFKSPTKNSLAINGIISTLAGATTAYKIAHKD